MNNIARFFTIYWCIYFPTCIAYNDLPGFSSIDEVMTGVIVIYTYAMKRIYSTNKKPWKEFNFFLGLLLFYTVYSLLFGVNVHEAVYYDLMQQVRPWSVIYCTWILNPQFTNKQKEWMRGTMLIIVITFIFYHPEMADAGSEYRSAPFGQLAICTSMAWYLFSDKSKKNMIITAIIAVVGLMGMKFKYYGQFGAWMFLLFYMKKRFDFKSMKIVWQIVFLLFLVILLGWERFNTYYIEGMDNEGLARPMINKATWEILWDYFPFGCGFGGFGVAAAAVYYSPLWHVYGLDRVWGLIDYHGHVAFHCDSFFGWFAEIGFFGVYFFVVFWKRRLQEINKIVDERYYKVAIMSFLCISIEWSGDQSFFSGKGMGYLMLLGLALNANYNQNIVDDDEEENDDDGSPIKKRKKGLIHLGHNFRAKLPKRFY